MIHARKLTPQQRAEIVHKYSVEKISAYKLAEQYGVHHSTIHNTLQEENVPKNRYRKAMSEGMTQFNNWYGVVLFNPDEPAPKGMHLITSPHIQEGVRVYLK